MNDPFGLSPIANNPVIELAREIAKSAPKRRHRDVLYARIPWRLIDELREAIGEDK